MKPNELTEQPTVSDAGNLPVSEVRRTKDKEYSVLVDYTVVGKIFLDYYDQVDKVLFYSAIPSQRRLVKELALSHAVQFMIRRAIQSAEVLALAPNRELHEYTCENLMRLEQIPDSIKNLDGVKLDAYLTLFAKVSEGRFINLAVMLENLVCEIAHDCGIFVGLQKVESSFSDRLKLTFCVTSPEHSFKIWKSADGYGRIGDYRLHITPPYHPVLSGKTKFCLINGDTDCYIRGSEAGIRSIFAPKDAVVGERFFGSSWSKLNHPFYAEGKTLTIELCPILCLSHEGYQTLFELLRAALNQGDSYVAVSGGFRSHYEYVGNLLARTGIKSPAGRHGTYNYRGSEHDCVWEYRVLEAENQLTGALLPDWFLREGWLKLYEEHSPKGTDNDDED